jgi:hypothetical protein
MKIQDCLLAAALGLLMSATLVTSVQAQSVSQQINDLKVQITALKTTVATLSNQLASVRQNPVLQLGPFVSVDFNTEYGVVPPNIVFKGANIHIVSGSGATNDNGNPLGLGNLILGYNVSYPGEDAFRTGSHNLIVGDYNGFTSTGGVVFGNYNTSRGPGAVVLGGASNYAGGLDACIVGGVNNATGYPFGLDSGDNCTVVGGNADFAGGTVNAIFGGWENQTSGASYECTVVGGIQNTATGRNDWLFGGIGTTSNADNEATPR